MPVLDVGSDNVKRRTLNIGLVSHYKWNHGHCLTSNDSYYYVEDSAPWHTVHHDHKSPIPSYPECQL